MFCFRQLLNSPTPFPHPDVAGGERGFSFICVDFVFLVFLVKDACLFVLYLIYFCLVV